MTAREGYLPRLVDEALAAAVASAPAVVIDGPRAVGKTTTARRLARSVVMLPRDLGALSADPHGYLAGLEAPVLIDEWQLGGPDLAWAIKQVVDEDPTPGRFILTGSVEPRSYGPTYPLTGRVISLTMRPMTLAELSGRGLDRTFLRGIVDGEALTPSAGRVSGVGLNALGRSGFPGARRMADPRLFLDGYANAVAQRAGEEGRDASRLLRTMRVLATLDGQAVPDQRIWEAADITKVTWKSYDDLLQRTFISVPVPAFESNRLKRLTSYPKRCLADTALALVLAGVATDQLESDPALAGNFLESFVVQQLRPQADALGLALSHLRTGAGEREVDIVVETPRGLLAFEVKRTARPDADDARHLTWLRDQDPQRFTRGFVVHTGGDSYPLGEHIWAVPLDVLAGAQDLSAT